MAKPPGSKSEAPSKNPKIRPLVESPVKVRVGRIRYSNAIPFFHGLQEKMETLESGKESFVISDSATYKDAIAEGVKVPPRLSDYQEITLSLWDAKPVVIDVMLTY